LSLITQASRTSHSMAVSFTISITPQVGTGLGGESPLPPPPPPPQVTVTAPPGSPFTALMYKHQALFECVPTHAATSAGFRTLSTTDHPAPMVLISDTSIEMALTEYLHQDSDAGPWYNYPDIILIAAKEFKKRQREEAAAHPKFAKFFDNIERLCIKVQETYLANPDTYDNLRFRLRTA